MRRALLSALVLLPAAALAHHGWGAYDAANPQTLTGRVEAYEPNNPHATMRLAVPGKTWDVVLSPPARMVARGLPLNRIRVGDTVTVMGYPHRTETGELRAEWIRVGEQVTQLR